LTIIFKEVRWKNLLSTGNAWTTISLTKHSSTLIVGENGAGKSTILDALCFGLYGRPFRKINKPQLVNTINQRNMLVEVEFNVGSKEYKVVRGMKPNVFQIYSDGSMINQDAKAKDYQDYLERIILQLNYKSFTQIVVLGSSTFVPFMQLKASDRREVIEDLLDIRIFSTMNRLLKDRLSDNKSSLREIGFKIDICREKIDLNNHYLQEQRDALTADIKDKSQRIVMLEEENQLLKDEITTLEAELLVLEESIAFGQKKEHQLTKMKTIEGALAVKIEKIDSDISFYATATNCPSCEQNIEHDHKNLMIEKKSKILKETTEGMELLEAELIKLNAYAKQLSSDMKIVRNKNGKIVGNRATINSNQKQADAIAQEIMAMEDKLNTEDVSPISQDALTEVAHHEALKEEMSRNQEVLSLAYDLLKDGGIKTAVIRQYIPIMNKLINKYLASMDFFVNFELNENFDESIKSRYRDEFSYASFSEGEKLRIDLSLLFTWRAIAKLLNSAHTNLLILDEIFDSSLDAAGTEEFMKILDQIVGDANIFIISHRSHNLADKFDNIITFEKHKNFSQPTFGDE